MTLSLCRSALAASLILLGVAALRGAAPLDPRDLFVPSGKYVTCRIPGLVVTPKGAILAYCEARASVRGDWDDEDILIRRSTDGGRTWTPSRVLIQLPEPQPVNPLRLDLRSEMGEAQVHARTYQNCIMIPDRDTGAVHVLFELDYWRCFTMRSDDDGATFSTPREITDVVAGYRQKGVAWRAVGNGCGHGIQLSNGRLLEALWLTDSTMPHGGGHRPGNVGEIYSDDHGATWHIGDWVKRAEAGDNPSETCEVQLSDGRVLFNSRVETTQHLRSITISPDGSSGWSASRLDPALFEPWCEASLLKIPTRHGHDRDPILFSNPDSRLEPASTRSGIGRNSRPRKNLTIKISYDDCQTWPVAKVVDAGVAGYSDLAMLPDGTLFCLYERGSSTGSQTANAALTLVRFDYAWLTRK